MLKPTILAAVLAVAAILPAGAASVSKTYSYFTIGGNTLADIEQQLAIRGPQLKSTGQRHPGATRMEFTTRLGYGEVKGYCRVEEAKVTVKANVILPRWRQRSKADRDVRLIWDTLSADIKRHEESHVIIAKNHARELEEALKNLPRQKSCALLAEKVKATTAAVLKKHDQAQDRFDRIEGKSFDKRLMRLLEYRLEQIEAGRIPGN